MDDKWFKAQQKRAGVTAEDIARKMGRDRTAVSHIYTGRRKMSLDWAKVFADVLQVPLDDVLRHAGVIEADETQRITPGFSDADVTPWQGPGGETEKIRQRAAVFGGDRPGVDVWVVRSLAMSAGGYMPGDQVLVDTHQSELCRAGDVVVAQNYNWQTGTAETVLRRFEPPVLVAASTDPADGRVLVTDGNNVVIKGKVIASWRG